MEDTQKTTEEANVQQGVVKKTRRNTVKKAVRRTKAKVVAAVETIQAPNVFTVQEEELNGLLEIALGIEGKLRGLISSLAVHAEVIGETPIGGALQLLAQYCNDRIIEKEVCDLHQQIYLFRNR